MKIKKFSSRSVPEALAAVRREFGDEAVIVSTKRSDTRPDLFEVIAAFDGARPVRFPRVDRQGRSVASDEGRPARPRAIGKPRPERPAAAEPARALRVTPAPPGVEIESLPIEALELSGGSGAVLDAPSVATAVATRTREKASAGTPEPLPEPLSEPADRVSLLDELASLKGRLETVTGLLLSRSPDDLPDDARRLHVRLLETGLDERLATTILRRAQKIDVPLDRAVHHILSSAVRIGGPLEVSVGQSVVALVGPTGVGKTTTAAKLAARLVMEEKRSVALVSADSFRVGGAEQLGFYAEILKAPFHEAGDRNALKTALDACSRADVVIVDTTGRGGSDAGGIGEIGEILAADTRVQPWLVLGAVASTVDNLAALRTFARLRPGGVIVTKLDEANAHGEVVSVLIRSGLPLRYLANGQRVPDDLRAAERDTIGDLLLGNAPA